VDRSSPHPHYQFGPFRIDAAKRVLLREGATVPLTPKCFEILLALVESGGEVVSKDDLMKRVWPDSFVEDGNLTYNVSVLRKALGERAGEHHYIVTAPGVGYRFVASLSEVCSADQEPTDNQNRSSAAVEATLASGDRDAIGRTNGSAFPLANEKAIPVDKEPRWMRRAVMVIALLFALVGFGYVLRSFLVRNVPEQFQRMRMTRLTTNGRVADAVISPDGKYAAYVLGEAGSQSVRVRLVATASDVEILPLADVEYYGLTFTQDGNHIYYVRHDGKRPMAYLYQVPTLGGASKKLLSDVDSRVSISPDGKQLAFIRFSPPEKLSRLIVAQADGSREEILAVRRGVHGFGQYGLGPSWSPDGKVIACPAYNNDADGLYVSIIGVRVADGEQYPITAERWSDVGQLAWLQDGSGIVATITEKASSTAQIWLVSYPSGETRRVTNDLNAYRGVTLAADSSSMIAVNTVSVCSLWIAPNGEAARARQISAGKLVGGADSACVPNTALACTPDDRIVFTSTKSGNQDIWIMNADGGDQKQLTVDAGANFSPSASMDGRYIVFVSDRAGSPNIWRMDVDGSNPKRLTNGSLDRWPRCSPDGRWVFYGGTSFGKPMVSKVSIDGGDSVRLSERFMCCPSLSPDGRLVATYYLDEEHPELPEVLAIVSSERGEITKSINNVSNYYTHWTADGGAITYARTRDGISNIYSQPLDGSPSKQVTDFNSGLIFQFAWSHDGKNLICARGVEASDVVLISNFR